MRTREFLMRMGASLILLLSGFFYALVCWQDGWLGVRDSIIALGLLLSGVVIGVHALVSWIRWRITQRK